MTHAVIDNLLRMIVRFADDLGRPAPALAKVGGRVTDARGGIERIVAEPRQSVGRARRRDRGQLVQLARRHGRQEHFDLEDG